MNATKDWHEVPNWCQFRAINANGVRRYYEFRPVLSTRWPHWIYGPDGGRSWYGGELPWCAEWKDSLEVRP
jgi:hypothetical protein